MLRKTLGFLVFFALGSSLAADDELLQNAVDVQAVIDIADAQGKTLKDELNDSRDDNLNDAYKMLNNGLSEANCESIKIYSDDTNWVGCYNYNY